MTDLQLDYAYIYGEQDALKLPHEQHNRCFPFTVVVYVRQGAYFCKIGNDNYTAHKREVLVVPEYVYHDIGMHDSGRLSWAHVSATCYGRDILSYYSVPAIIQDDNAAKIGNAVNLLTQAEITADSIQRRLLIDIQVCQIMQTIIAVSEPVDTLTDDERNMQKVSDYIVCHITESFTLSGLAKSVNMSESKLSKCFKDFCGVSPIDFVLDRKIKNAIHLLLTGHSIKETAQILSFYDEYYFSKQFKRRVGCSPARYAKTHNFHSC